MKWYIWAGIAVGVAGIGYMIWWQMTKEETPTNGEELPEGAVARRV